MKYLISYSGGRGSAASVLLAHENKLDYEVIFADTLIEDEDLYNLNSKLEKIINKKIIVLKDGRDPWKVFEDKRYIGNSRTAHCSQELKTKVVQKYITSNYNSDQIKLVLGMGLSEEDRIERARLNWFPIKIESLLITYKYHSNKQINDLLFKYWIELPRLYKKGFPHNNCGGFCVRAGLKQFALFLLNFPEKFDEHANKMEETMRKIGSTAKPFLRATIDGELKYITLKEFKQLFLANKLSIEPYDFGGCGCFIDK